MVETLNEGAFGVNLFQEEVNSFDFSRSYEYTEVMNILACFVSGHSLHCFALNCFALLASESAFLFVSFTLHRSLSLLITIVPPLFLCFSPLATLWALLQLEQTVYAPLGALLIGSQLNSPVDGNCRIAFYAKIIQALPARKEDLSILRVFKPKQRTAIVDRVVNDREVIGTNLTEKGGSIAAVGEGASVKSSSSDWMWRRRVG